MRSIGVASHALDLMIQRVTDPARKTFGKFLYQHGEFYFRRRHLENLTCICGSGTVVAEIARSRAEIESARLLVLSAALQVSTCTPYYSFQPLMCLEGRQTAG